MNSLLTGRLFRNGSSEIRHEKSIVTINITPDGENSLVTVEQSNIPDDDFADISEGWREYYIGAIINFFNPNF